LRYPTRGYQIAGRRRKLDFRRAHHRKSKSGLDGLVHISHLTETLLYGSPYVSLQMGKALPNLAAIVSTSAGMGVQKTWSLWDSCYQQDANRVLQVMRCQTMRGHTIRCNNKVPCLQGYTNHVTPKRAIRKWRVMPFKRILATFY
jgi:hypothetical protein